MRRPLTVAPSRLRLAEAALTRRVLRGRRQRPSTPQCFSGLRRPVSPKVSESLQDGNHRGWPSPSPLCVPLPHGPCDRRWLLEVLELVPAPWRPRDPSGVRRHLCRRAACEPPVSGGLSVWPGFSRSVFVPGAAAQSTRLEDGRKEPMALAGGPDSFLHHPYYQV